MSKQIKFELGKKYKVFLADGTVIIFTFVGGEPPMITTQDGSMVSLYSLTSLERVEECEE